MLSAKIQSVRMAMATLAGNIPQESWVLVRGALAELDDAGEIAGRLESSTLIQDGGGEPRLLRPLYVSTRRPIANTAKPAGRVR